MTGRVRRLSRSVSDRATFVLPWRMWQRTELRIARCAPHVPSAPRHSKAVNRLTSAGSARSLAGCGRTRRYCCRISEVFGGDQATRDRTFAGPIPGHRPCRLTACVPTITRACLPAGPGPLPRARARRTRCGLRTMRLPPAVASLPCSPSLFRLVWVDTGSTVNAGAGWQKRAGKSSRNLQILKLLTDQGVQEQSRS